MATAKRKGRLSVWFAGKPLAGDRRDEAFLRFFPSRPGVRKALFILGFLSLAATVALVPRLDPLGNISIGMGREKAIETARQAVLARGVDVAGWRAFATLSPEPGRLREKIRHPAAVSPLDELSPPVALQVIFWSPERQQNVMIQLAPDGQLTGFRHSFPETGTEKPADRAGDAALAESAFRKRFPGNLGGNLKLENAPAAAGAPEGTAGATRKGGSQTIQTKSRFFWSGSVEGQAASFLVVVAGGRIAEESFRLQAKGQEVASGQSIGFVVAVILIVLLWFVAAIYGIFRFGFRLREKEVAFRRALLLAFLVIVCAILAGWMTDMLFFEQMKQQSDPGAAGILALFGFAFLGIIGGIVWAAGEGDLREALPGSATSFDALLGRKLWSRNVGRSVLVGLGVTGFYGLAKLVLVGGTERILGLDAPLKFETLMAIVADKWGGAHLLLAPVTVVVAALLFLLMLPFSFRIARGARKGMAVFAFVFMVSFSPLVEVTQGFHTSEWLALAVGLLLGLGSVLALLWGDLLAALVLFLLQEFPRGIGLALGQGDGSLRASGAAMCLEMLVLILFAAAAARWGREWREEEVRPAHAWNIAERKSLKAEFELARATRSSLMPPALTAPDGLAVADRVVTSAEIGGDYRDAFALPDGRWSWVVADSGGGGTGAAIAMALTKGLLLACVRRNLSAAEGVLRVEQGLIRALGSGALSGLVFCVHDLGRREVSIARFGGMYPRLFGKFGRDGGWRPVEETVATLPFPEGSVLACWTDGAENITDPWGLPVGRKTLTDALSRDQTSAERVVAALERAIQRKAGRLRDGHVRDEIAIVALAAAPPGGVA